MADGLDYSQTGTTVPTNAVIDGTRTVIHLEGVHAAADGRRAGVKADLWRAVMGNRATFVPVDASSAWLDKGVTPRLPGLGPNDPMDVAAYKVLLFHLRRMVKREDGTRDGSDIEELHQMRVATRRMRAALLVWADDLDAKTMAPHAKGLRRTARALGAVRDLDVFREKAQEYLDAQAAESSADLDPLFEVWAAARISARTRMLDYLNSQGYARFREAFGQLLAEAVQESLAPCDSETLGPRRRLKDAAPALIFDRLARVRSFEELVARPDTSLNTYHQLRIAAKQLRYTLEFLEDVLASSAEDAIDAVVALQDHLGAMQDAVVASGILRNFLTWGSWDVPKGKKSPLVPETVIAPGVARYLAVRQGELHSLLHTFAPVYEPLCSTRFRRKLTRALRPLW
jgi:CHAD domain-containing protein